MPMNIHDRARALSLSSGVALTAAYSELARRSAARRRAKRPRRILGTMTATAADIEAASYVESPRHWLPYADN